MFMGCTMCDLAGNKNLRQKKNQSQHSHTKCESKVLAKTVILLTKFAKLVHCKGSGNAEHFAIWRHMKKKGYKSSFADRHIEMGTNTY